MPQQCPRIWYLEELSRRACWCDEEPSLPATGARYVPVE